MEWASKFVEKAIDFVLDVSIRHLCYIISYEGNVKGLNNCVEDLGLKRDRVEHKVVDAENNVKGIEADVKVWIEKVGTKINEINEFQNDEAHTKTGCSRGLLPYLTYRHRLGRKAKKLTLDAKLLIDEGKFDGVSFQQNPKSKEATFSNAGYEEFGSRKDIIKKIMEALRDSTVRMIGIHGPVGVGKTTLVKQIAKKAQVNKLFDVPIIINVSKNPDLQRIQGEIAYELGLTFEGEGEAGRADRLRRRLKKEKESILLILDDIWDGLDLNKLGIPFDDDDDDDNLGQVTVKDKQDLGYKKIEKEKSPGDYKGCKILLTSRIKEVLSDKMDVKKKSIFYVKELDDEEVVRLFKKMAEIPDGNSDFDPELVKYCAGLPMAIVTIGRALRNKSKSEQKDALEKLKKQKSKGVQKSMELSVKMSYDHLESEELKFIFLVCARLGHQPLIMDLVKYCFGLGMLEGVDTLKEARERISTAIQKLRDSSLLLDDNSKDHFSMHDMLRDAALSIAHEAQNAFTLRDGKLDDWPDEDVLERCTVISIHNSDIIDELPKVINCPHLKVFHIDSDNSSLEIPENFFEGMQKLRVLILTGIHLRCLPSSIKCLSNLRMLCLERCVVDGSLSIIGELKKLRILSLSGSKIENLPVELGHLSKLQLLDISDCSIVNVIPPNFISCLTSLEELYVRNCLFKTELEGETNPSLITILAGLRHLHRLTFLDIRIPSAAVLPRNLFLDKLNDYKIVIGDFKMLSIGDFKWPHKYEASRSLALELKDGTDIHSQKGIKMLFKKVENLLLGELNGVQNAFYELNLDGFPCLKHLSIINNCDMEYIIYSKELSHPLHVFCKLESLSLYKLGNMKKICCSPVTDVSFSKLKSIKVKMCSQLENLFSFDMVKLLTSLETIDVSECNSLGGIVVNERVNTDKVEFPQLRSLNLQSLESFTGFYTNIPQVKERVTTNGDQTEITIAEDELSVTAFSLFSELVEIPNLESLNLSSIRIDKIWIDQPFSSSRFQSLKKLTVKDCNNLRYLFSFSVARSLANLKGLFVSECQMMETIFITEKNSADYSKDRIFPKLEEIQLTNMKMLKEMWHAEISAESFSSLTSVYIGECHKLDKIFPSHMAGRFGNLDSLNVSSCDSVEVIFELNASPQIDTRLRVLHLFRNKMLKQVWNSHPTGILNFKNLQNVKVWGCDALNNVFPASVAEVLENLEEFKVSYCERMGEIVGPGASSTRNPLVFPQMVRMKLIHLPNVKHFYMGTHTVECPKLKRLEVLKCENLETFTTESTNTEGQRQPLFSAEKVIPNLEYMRIDLKEAKWLQGNAGKYLMRCLKELEFFSLPSIEILYWFLHRIPNLEKLTLFDPAFDEFVPRRNIAPQERMGTIVQLKELTLRWPSSLKDIGFERDPVLERVERLSLYGCDRLINFAHPSVSFTQLTYLEVCFCGRLISLMASSTARSLVQLTTMKVKYCHGIKDIVSNEGNEDERGDDNVHIVFSNLTTLELVALGKLTSFCCCKNCKFNFPSLEKLIVRECPKMKTFSQGHITAPKLQNILGIEGEEEDKGYWEGDLNATIQKIFTDKVSFKYMESLEFSDYPEIEEVWHGKVSLPDDSFRNLKTLVMENCEHLSFAIPSIILAYLNNLERLTVHSCSLVEAIFEIDDAKVRQSERIAFGLKALNLYALPNLKHVWNKNPQGILSFENLEDFSVNTCEGLQTLFPASVAKSLLKLKTLNIGYCERLMEIVTKEEAASTGAINEFEFPGLRRLTLNMLPELKCFYPGRFNLNCAALKELCVSCCGKFSIFTSESPSHEEARPEDRADIPINAPYYLFPVQKVAPNLECMTIGLEEARSLEGNIGKYLMGCLKELTLHSLPSIEILYWFLHRTPNLEKLTVYKPAFDEFVPSGNIAPQERMGTVVQVQLKELRLEWASSLEHIGFERDPVLERVERLSLFGCDRLINFAHPSVSFTQLTYLEVCFCSRLISLMASSTARSLFQLTTMKVKNCGGIKEIVTNERNEDETEDDDVHIVFSNLTTLELVALGELTSFCWCKNCKFNFPSLEKLIVRECPKMKTFAQGHITAPKLQNILATKGEEEDKGYWEGDLNATIQKIFTDKVSFKYRVSLNFSDYPEIEEVWHGKVSLPDDGFRNLKTLMMQNCEHLSFAIPSMLLAYLNNLERLEVRRCSLVEAIFEIDDAKVRQSERIAFGLKTLDLYALPNLKHVWNKNPQGILSLENLEDFRVNNCEGLQTLFPASVAKGLLKLETLEIEGCERLMEIVTNEEAASTGATNEFLFPGLTSLTLNKLPELKCFYPGRFNLNCPVLKELRVSHCGKFRIFTSESPSHEEGSPEDRVDIPINAQYYLFSVQKVVPKLETLTFDDKDTLRQGEYQEDLLNKLKCLALQCFHNVNETDTLPYEFFHKVPNLETLEVRCSGFNEIFSSQGPEADYVAIFPHLKELIINTLCKLSSIGLEHSWLDSLRRNLEILELSNCPRLTKLVQSTIPFSSLTELRVYQCHGLLSLFTSSTAKSLVLLEVMIIENCESIKEIVAKEVQESISDEIIFGKLEWLYLGSLSSLVSFYTGNSHLTFPALKEVAIFKCPRMQTFSQGVIKWPNLEAIEVSWQIDGRRGQLGDLNTTVDKFFKEKLSFEYLEHLNPSNNPELQQIWFGEAPPTENCFRRLTTLAIENSEFPSIVIPSHLLPYLKNLEELKVGNCSSVEAIVDVNRMKGTRDEEETFRLKRLILYRLPYLTDVWNKNPHGILSFNSLQKVKVTDCESLKTLFPAASAAKDLANLHTLEIQNCVALVEIVGKDKADSEVEMETFVFNRLTSLTLNRLPALKCFYPGKFSLECPVLRVLNVYHCGKVEILTSDFQSYEEAMSEDQVRVPIDAQPLFSVQKVTPNLEELSLSKKERKMLWHGDYPTDLLHKIKLLQLHCYHEVTDEDVLPYEFLPKVPNIEILAVACSDFKEIFPSQSLEVENINMLAQLRGLRLEVLSELNSIGLEHSWLDPLRKNLEVLEVRGCPRLTKLVKSPISLSNMKELILNGCCGLEHLFTSSTAKSLVHLKKMSIEKCESIEEIMAKAGDEIPEDVITFEWLRHLSLISLSGLASFYTGSSTLNLPSLEKVIIMQCPKMKIFSQGPLNAPMLPNIQSSLDEKDLYWEGDLNATVQKLCKGKGKEDDI